MQNVMRHSESMVKHGLLLNVPENIASKEMCTIILQPHHFLFNHMIMLLAEHLSSCGLQQIFYTVSKEVVKLTHGSMSEQLHMVSITLVLLLFECQNGHQFYQQV